MTISALYPGASRPIRPAKPSARAPPSVAARATSRVVSHRRQSGPRTFEAKEASRIASYMFWLSEQLAPSVPMPRLTRRSRIGNTAAEPHIAARIMRDRGAAVPEPPHILVIEPYPVRHREMRPEHAEPVEMRGLGQAVKAHPADRLDL